MQRKIFNSLATGALLAFFACSPRQVDDGIYTSEEGYKMNDATATDRAETTIATIDTAALVMPADTAAGKKKQKHL